MSLTNNLNLYQLAIEHQKLLSQLYDPETGEINMEVDAQLNQVIESSEKKCVAVASWIQTLNSERIMLDHAYNELEQRRAAYNKKIADMNRYLQSNMERCGIKEIRNPFFTVKLKKNPVSTEILNESEIPAQFMREREIKRVEIKPDKNAIKEEVLRTGVQVPGALVVQKNKLEIIIDKI
jgi:hypothetical protein